MYKKYRKICKKYAYCVDLEIAIAVSNALPTNAQNRTFEALCGYTRALWNKADLGYTQLMADIVVDSYFHNYHIHNNLHLTIEDLENLNRLDEKLSLFYNKYYEH